MGKKLTEDQVLKRLEEKRDRQTLPHSLKVMYYNTVRDSAVKVTCLHHNRSETRSVDQYLNTSYGLSCCATPAIRRSGTVAERQEAHQEKLNLLAKARGHVIADLCFISRRKCTFTVSCNHHRRRYKEIKYSNYTSPNVSYGVHCCAYPVVSQNPKSDKEREQLSNRDAKWKRKMVPSKKERWCCSLTNLMALGDVGAITIHAHHLYGSGGYPSLRHVVKNGVLLHSILHLEFQKTVRKPLDITPQAFLFFLECLSQEESYLLGCLNNLQKQLEAGGWFLNCRRRVHPITREGTYYAEQGVDKEMGKKRSIYLPTWLVDNLQAGLPPVQERLKAMRGDVEQKMTGLALYLDDQALIPYDERNMFL